MSGFNHRAAGQIVKAMTAMDEDSALVYGQMVLAQIAATELVNHGDEIYPELERRITKRAELLRGRIAKVAVTETRAGKDTTPLMSLLEEVVKADNWRHAAAEREARDTHGRFAVVASPIVHTARATPVPKKHATALGIPTPSGLSGAALAHFQNGYHQLANLIAPYAHIPDTHPLLHVTYQNGAHQTIPIDTSPGAKNRIPVGDEGLDASKKVIHAVVTTQGDWSTLGGGTFNALAAAHLPTAGRYAASATQPGSMLDAEGLRRYQQARETNLDDEFSRSSRAFRRLAATSELLQSSFGQVAPPKAQFALAVGRRVGELGPEAQKIVQPAADRAAYRYRGTQRPIDPGLAAQFNQDRGERGVEDLTHGDVDPASDRWRPGPLLAIFRARLPKTSLNRLQTASGTVPPSEGVIIDAKGKPVTQAVGYGDDWYLPFKLKNLKRLKGGQYVRTRTFGGPTTEDIYTGLISGAKSVTVVSHAGVYNIDFDRDFTGTRRFNDKAARMVARYGQLLDAVQSEQVTTGGLHPARLKELSDQAAEAYPPEEDEASYHAEFERLKNAERRNPKLSAAQQAEATREWAARFQGRTSLEEHLARTLSDYKATLRPLALNGEGYNLALQALREQFPYYIDNVEFHRWDDAEPGRDTGYIAPRHNRPARVQAGYFNRDVTGHGKVSAQTTRFQNFAVHHGAREIEPREQPKPDESRREAGSDQELAGSAMRKLLTHIHGLSKFASGATVPGVGDVGGLDPHASAKESSFPSELKELFTADGYRGLLDQIDSAPDKVKAKLNEALDYIDRNHLFDLDTSLVDRFRSGGMAKQHKLSEGTVSQLLSRADEEHALGGFYSPARRSTPEELVNAYQADGNLEPLRNQLPGLGDTDFHEKANRLRDALRSNQDQLLEERRRGAGHTVDEGRLRRSAEALVRAKQLRRRYEEATKRGEQGGGEGGEGGIPLFIDIGGPEGPRLRLGPQREATGQAPSMAGFESQFTPAEKQRHQRLIELS